MKTVENQLAVNDENNSVISYKVDEYVNRYSLCVKVTTESILSLASVVNEAKTNLTTKEFKIFRNEINADKSKDSYIKKLIIIAKNAARLNPLSDKLPASYTTLYSITQLSDEEFTRLCNDNILSSSLTAKQLSIYTEKKLSKNTNDFQLIINFSKLSDSDKYLAFTEIKNICDKFKIELNSNVQSAFQGKIQKLSDLTQNLVEDAEVIEDSSINSDLATV